MLEVAVCGAGNWGKNLVRNFENLPDARVRFICDLSESVRRRMSDLYPQATVTDELEAALEDPKVDAVVVAVDAGRHYAVARAALEAAKHVFVEKPLTLSSAECVELIQLSRQTKRKLMVGHLLEYHPAVNYMKRMIVEGELDPLYCYSQRVNLGVVRQTENAWWSLAPHDISMACYLMNAEPVSVVATGECYLQDGIEDVVFANVTFADGRMAHIHVSWLDPHKIRKMTLVGLKKMVVFDDMHAAERIRIFDKGAEINHDLNSYGEAISLRQGDILIPAVSNIEPLRIECEHFVDCILTDSTPRSDGEDGLRVVRVLEAGSASLQQGGVPVSIAAASGVTEFAGA